MDSAFDAIAADARSCRICRDTPTGPVLPHEPRPVLSGRASSPILIVGQAPGTRVHASGKPFTDPSGDRLRDWMGIDETLFYDESLVAIIPMGFCFPGLDARGGDLPPRKECAPQWRSGLMAALDHVELIVAVGMYALKWHLGADCGRSLAETIAQWRQHTARKTPLLALPHPSWRNQGWLKRHPFVAAEVIPDLRTRVETIVRVHSSR